MIKLHELPALNKKRKRIGRGGKLGGTSTRGFGGQKARSGDSNVRVGFEGGQMPLFRRLPKRGFNNADFKREVAIINLNQLELFFAAGDTVTLVELVNMGLIKGHKPERIFVKILGNGQLTKALTVHANAFSDSARKAIGAQGGQAVNKESTNRGVTE